MSYGSSWAEEFTEQADLGSQKNVILDVAAPIGSFKQDTIVASHEVSKEVVRFSDMTAWTHIMRCKLEMGRGNSEKLLLIAHVRPKSD